MNTKLEQLKKTLDESWILFEHYDDVTEIHRFIMFLNNEIKKLEEEVKVENPFDTEQDKIEALIDFVDENFNMEILTDNKMQYTFEEIDKFPSYEEMKLRAETGTEEENRYFKEFSFVYREVDRIKGNGYKCIYAVDSESMMWGQGYIIVDKDLEFVEFIRTI